MTVASKHGFWTDRERSMEAKWEVTPEKAEEAIRRIVEVSQPRRLILFGSYVRGDLKPHSDLDILVITPDEPDTPRRESVRIRRALRGIPMAMDILVVGQETLDRAADVPGLIYREAVREGTVAYESAG